MKLLTSLKYKKLIGIVLLHVATIFVPLRGDLKLVLDSVFSTFILLFWFYLIKEKTWKKLRFVKIFVTIMFSLYILGGVVLMLDTGDYCIETAEHRTCFYDNSLLELYVMGEHAHPYPTWKKSLGMYSIIAELPTFSLSSVGFISNLTNSNKRTLFPWDPHFPTYEQFK